MWRKGHCDDKVTKDQVTESPVLRGFLGRPGKGAHTIPLRLHTWCWWLELQGSGRVCIDSGRDEWETTWRNDELGFDLLVFERPVLDLLALPISDQLPVPSTISKPLCTCPPAHLQFEAPQNVTPPRPPACVASRRSLRWKRATAVTRQIFDRSCSQDVWECSTFVHWPQAFGR